MNNFNNITQQIVKLIDSNEYDKAEKLCFEIIKVNPTIAEIYNMLAIISGKKNNLEQAIYYMKKTISLDSNNYLYYLNIGELYRKAGNLEESIICLEKSINLNPVFSVSKLILGMVYISLNNINKAKDMFNKVLELDPNEYRAYQHLGNIAYNENLYNEAIKYYMKYLITNPEDDSINYLIGVCFSFTENLFLSEYYYKKAESINPENINVLKALHIMLINQSRTLEAIEYLNKYINLSKKQGTYNLAIEIYKDTYISNFDFNNILIEKDRKNLIDNIRKYKKMDLEYYEEYQFNKENIFPHSQLLYQNYDNRFLKEEFADIFYKSFPYQQKEFNKGKIKVGFVVTKNESLFCKFMEYILNNLDRNDFEVYFIGSFKAKNSKYLNSLKNTEFIFIDENLTKYYDHVNSLNLNIIYHWEIGTESINYFLPFFKVAPVQCTSIGWPDTSGIKTVDYFISSKLIETDKSQEYYTEKLYLFNNLPLYCEKPELKEYKDIEYFGLSKKNNIYFCGQTLRKISPDFDNLVAGILRKDLNGIVVFINPSNNDRIAELLDSRMKVTIPDVIDRIVFLNKMSHQDYLSLLTHSDVFLDTLYFGGANTAYDCFAMETPIVTLPFTHERGRYVLGCYKQMNIEGLVANDENEYIDLAVKTATDKVFRTKIVENIKNNNHLLYSDTSLLEEYSNFFKKVSRK